ncbi:MAG: ABC transporter permease, partial [Candidatus Thermoplasmatota archaeon]|nr:ABC transporter permease [Candidatus Thermoplasmatota archaeon]
PSDSPRRDSFGVQFARRRPLDLRAVWALLKKEFLDSVRNRWIIALSAIFIILTLVISFFGAAQTGGGIGFQGLFETVAGMTAISTILIPILGLMLSYAAVVGEKERGSILLLLSMPITRLETILGKFLGLGAVMLVAVLSGLGIGGIVIMAFTGTEGWENFIVFLLGAIVFALAFLSVGLLLSSVTKRRSLAMGLAVFLWFFFAFIFDLILLGIFVATGGSFLPIPGQPLVFPDWVYVAQLANPVQAFSSFAVRAFGVGFAFGFPIELPDFVSIGTTGLSMALWALVPLGLAAWRFRGQDL